MYEYLSAGMYVDCVLLWYLRKSEEVLGPLELEFRWL